MSQDREGFVKYFKKRFGVEPATWQPYRLQFGKQSVHLVSDSIPELSWDIEDQGLRVARLTTNLFKPSSRGFQWLGDRISNHRIELSSDSMQCLLDRQPVTFSDPPAEWSRGYVAVFYQQQVIGCGFWTGNELETQVSKAQGRVFPRSVLNSGGA